MHPSINLKKNPRNFFAGLCFNFANLAMQKCFVLVASLSKYIVKPHTKETFYFSQELASSVARSCFCMATLCNTKNKPAKREIPEQCIILTSNNQRL